MREDRDRRGRAPGEIARLIIDEVARVAPGLRCEHLGDSRSALTRVAAEASEGAMVVFYHEHFGEAHEALLALGAQPASSLTVVRQAAQGEGTVLRSTTAGS